MSLLQLFSKTKEPIEKTGQLSTSPTLITPLSKNTIGVQTVMLLHIPKMALQDQSMKTFFNFITYIIYIYIIHIS